jgi:hypothetical protein
MLGQGVACLARLVPDRREQLEAMLARCERE